MSRIAIIAGSGFAWLTNPSTYQQQRVTTPFGTPLSPLLMGEWAGNPVILLARHGQQHTIAPHKINYRANIWALHAQGVDKIIAVAAVGAINKQLALGQLVVPDQIIDYSYGREHSFFSDDFTASHHLDFTEPYTESLRQQIIHAATQHPITSSDGGTYGVTQGPRLETAAEINRMAQDGCTIVGMTAMPEAYLARELAMDYASCAIVANWAAGITDNTITITDIEQTLAQGMTQLNPVLAQVMAEN